MRIRVKVSRHRQFGTLARRFREAAAGGLQDDLTGELRRIAPPVLTAVQQRLLGASFPAEKTGKFAARNRSTGLRARIAAATKIEPLTAPPGVRFTVDGEGVNPASGRAGHKLAQYTDGSARRRWRHTIFDMDPTDPKAWFNQKPDPWFFTTIAPTEPQFAAGVERAMDRTARRIMR